MQQDSQITPPPMDRWPVVEHLPGGPLVVRVPQATLVLADFTAWSFTHQAKAWADTKLPMPWTIDEHACPAAAADLWLTTVALAALEAGLSVQVISPLISLDDAMAGALLFACPGDPQRIQDIKNLHQIARRNLPHSI